MDKTTPKDYAAQLIKKQGGADALRIARESFVNSREQVLPEYSNHKDPRVVSKRTRALAKSSRFWDQVFGIILQRVLPGTKRGPYMAGLVKKAS